MATVTDTPPKFDLTHAASATALPDISCLAYAVPRVVFVNTRFGVPDAIREQAWFWTTAWQAGEREANAERDAGDLEEFDSSEAFLKALRGIAHG